MWFELSSNPFKGSKLNSLPSSSKTLSLQSFNRYHSVHSTVSVTQTTNLYIFKIMFLRQRNKFSPLRRKFFSGKSWCNFVIQIKFGNFLHEKLFMCTYDWSGRMLVGQVLHSNRVCSQHVAGEAEVRPLETTCDNVDETQGLRISGLENDLRAVFSRLSGRFVGVRSAVIDYHERRSPVFRRSCSNLWQLPSTLCLIFGFSKTQPRPVLEASS